MAAAVQASGGGQPSSSSSFNHAPHDTHLTGGYVSSSAKDAFLSSTPEAASFTGDTDLFSPGESKHQLGAEGGEGEALIGKLKVKSSRGLSSEQKEVCTLIV